MLKWIIINKFKRDYLLNFYFKDGIESGSNETHPSNASFPISVTDWGIIIYVSNEQYWKAFFPILVTEEGILISIKEEQLKKALSFIIVIEDGIITSDIFCIHRKGLLQFLS